VENTCILRAKNTNIRVSQANQRLISSRKVKNLHLLRRESKHFGTFSHKTDKIASSFFTDYAEETKLNRTFKLVQK